MKRLIIILSLAALLLVGGICFAEPVQVKHEATGQTYTVKINQEGPTVAEHKLIAYDGTLLKGFTIINEE